MAPSSTIDVSRPQAPDVSSFAEALTPGTEGAAHGTLSVDTRHPFFFDHELDHVPGTLLLAGFLDLKDRTLDARPGNDSRISLTISFARMCELAGEVTLTGQWDSGLSGTQWRFAAVQAGRDACTADAEITYADPLLPLGVFGWDAPRRPAPAHLVHRAHECNIMVGDTVKAAGETIEATVLEPPPGHYLRRHGEAMEGRFSVLELIESGRQFVTMLRHVALGDPLGTHHIWASSEWDIPNGLDRSIPLIWRWARVPRERRQRLRLILIRADTGERVGGASYEFCSMDRAAYERKRARDRGEA